MRRLRTDRSAVSRRFVQNVSPVIMQGKRTPGWSTYRLGPAIDCKVLAIICNAEL